jgi:AraC-like DNA-binding protein
MRERLVFESPIVTIREIVCDAARGHGGAPECNEIPCIAVPLRGCYAVERRRNDIVADANTAAFFYAGAPYRVSHPTDGGDVTMALTFDDATFAGAFGDARPSNAPLTAEVQMNVRLLCRRIAGGGDPLAAEEAAAAIACSIARSARVMLSRARSAAVELAKAFLGDHFREKILLADVARAARTSPFTLARLFPAATGTTLHSYLLALRHADALHEIAAGANDLSRVAADAGFAHHSHLTKSFSRAFGTTPSQLRSALTQ